MVGISQRILKFHLHQESDGGVKFHLHQGGGVKPYRRSVPIYFTCKCQTGWVLVPYLELYSSPYLT